MKTKTETIVRSLLARADQIKADGWVANNAITDAADMLEELQAEVERLKAENKQIRSEKNEQQKYAVEIGIKNSELEKNIQILESRVTSELEANERLTGEVERLRAERGSKASSDVLAERQRQIEAEGHDHEHDDQKASGELALAAACYTLHSVARENGHEQNAVPSPWPWSPNWWKPTNTRRDLVKAAALIIAEIERIDRIG